MPSRLSEIRGTERIEESLTFIFTSSKNIGGFYIELRNTMLAFGLVHIKDIYVRRVRERVVL